MKRGTPRHPKLDDLMRAAKVKRSTAVGWLELLWHATAEFAPQGNIGRCSDDWIEAQLDWSGRRGQLIEYLTSTRWLDRHSEYRLLVHDWHDHADDSVRKRLSRAGLCFLSNSVKVTGHYPDRDRILSGTHPDIGSLPLPEPLPEPIPEPTPIRPPGVRRAATVADLNGQTSLRFPEWFDDRWAPVRGNAYRGNACQAYSSTVTIALESEAFACTDSYLVGPGSDPAHGYRPDNFLFQMARDGFKTRWPPAKQERQRTGWASLKDGGN